AVRPVLTPAFESLSVYRASSAQRMRTLSRTQRVVSMIVRLLLHRRGGDPGPKQRELSAERRRWRKVIVAPVAAGNQGPASARRPLCQVVNCPPSAIRTEPVTYDASSEASHRIG